jgi:NAD(P)-dependent dehydrogenase (short-subunit alcohol dehydrogenase family)
MGSVRDAFSLKGHVVVITGGAGLLGVRHGQAVAEMGGIPVLADIAGQRAEVAAGEMSKASGCEALGLATDVTRPDSVQAALREVLASFGRIDGLVNNAAVNPVVAPGGLGSMGPRLEQFPLAQWQRDLDVGLTGAFVCSQVFGTEMARRGAGAIVNIASDLALIAPDQRIYRDPSLPSAEQPVKPVTYSVVKSGLLGLTRYLATYWAERGVRVNALSPGGVRTDQDESFVRRLSALIPLGRMAQPDEYQAALVYLLSNASSYMTGANLVVDGGRTAW